MPALFNQILLLDSLPEDQRGSFRRLEEDVSLRAALAPTAPAVVPVRVESFGQFANVIQQVTVAVQQHPLVPMLHLECHGGHDGIEFADGSMATWREFKEVITPLNVVTRLNLVVVVSACHGSDLAGAVCTTERAPVWGLIGPTREMTAHELELGFSAFYRELLATGSSEDALKALRTTAEPGAYMMLSAETIFREVLKGYRERHETEEALKRRASQLQARLRAVGAYWRLEDVLAQLRNPMYFEDFYQKFFMIDLLPEHADRFPRDQALGPLVR